MEQTSQTPAAGTPNAFSPLICIDRIDETPDAATFAFRSADASHFDYKPGQFITFQVDVADERLHRAYSLSSTPSRPESIAITVKRVPGGRVSNHLIDHLKPGHMLPAMAPAGEFNLFDCKSTHQLVLLSAGSGITPCISIARWLLDTDAQAEILFIYSARTNTDVIMADQLAKLDTEHENFRLVRVLSQDADGEHQGRLDASLFEQIVPDLTGRTIFTCGPQSYMEAMESFASARGFDMDYFHKESFVPPSVGANSGENGASFKLQVPKFGKSADISADSTLLEALEAAQVPIIGACRTGVCGSCKCKVTEGAVESTSQATLSADEIAAGYVLACSSRATSDLAIEL